MGWSTVGFEEGCLGVIEPACLSSGSDLSDTGCCCGSDGLTISGCSGLSRSSNTVVVSVSP